MTRFHTCLPQVFLLNTVIALLGCENLPIMDSLSGTTPSSEAQQLERQVDDFNQTIAEGAMAGAAIGALAGLLLGDNKESAAKGAVAGAIGGTAFGYYIAGQKQKFANREQALDSLAQDLHETNRSLQAMVNTSERILAEDQRRVDKLRKQILAGEAQQVRNNELIAQLKSDRKILSKAISASKERYDAAFNNMKSYEQQFGVQGIEQLEALLTNYRAQQDILASLESSMYRLIEDAETSANI